MNNKYATSEEEIMNVLEETLDYLVNTGAPTEVIENVEWALGPKGFYEEQEKLKAWVDGTPINSKQQVLK